MTTGDETGDTASADHIVEDGETLTVETMATKLVGRILVLYCMTRKWQMFCMPSVKLAKDFRKKIKTMATLPISKV